MYDDAVLDAADTGRKALVISVYRELSLFCVQMLLDTFELFASPFICLTVTYKVVIFKIGRTRSIAISLIYLFVPWIRDCHELVSETEVEMALV